MSAGDVLARVVSRLERAGIPHMIAGSFASAYHGVPRATRDIDIVVDPSPAALEALLAELPAADYYVDHDAARDALRQASQFNIIDTATGWKVEGILAIRGESLDFHYVERWVAALDLAEQWSRVRPVGPRDG